MERENRKRTREEEEKQENKKEKKAEFECNKEGGVFDFPWLKEGVIFKGDEYLELQDTFGTCLYEIPSIFTENLDQFCVENLCDEKVGDDYKIDENYLGTFQEPEDCIWSSVIDQPLDIGFNKL
ncbi:unnamed protein product [Fraxinus pennsylvanica]|uniref:Uncharacterized protein n=1 Tax=Fraxinus pennsylvanica TaxID=56036 RepID=A0AAD1YXQ1_9LAMI|nr:unnamed protein product [Fraxinus pennsylvanica]